VGSGDSGSRGRALYHEPLWLPIALHETNTKHAIHTSFDDSDRGQACFPPLHRAEERRAARPCTPHSLTVAIDQDTYTHLTYNSKLPLAPQPSPPLPRPPTITVAAVQVPSVPPTPSGGDLGAAGVAGGVLVAAVAGAGAVANALTAKGKAIVEAERKKAIEAAAAAEFARQQSLRKKGKLSPGPSDGVRLAIAGGILAASAGIFGAIVLAPQAEAPVAVVKEVKKAAPAPAPKPAAPAPAAPKVEAPKPVAEAPKPVEAVKSVEAPKPVEAPKAGA
jgi:hypothetical protein